MAIQIEIRRTSQPPTERKSWPERAAHKNVIVQEPNRCLTSPGITEHKVRMAVVVKISYYGRSSAGDGRRGEVQFRARDIPGGVLGVDDAACDEHFAVGQQRLCVIRPPGGEAAGGAPGPAGWIVQFRAPESAGVVRSSCDEHLAVGQQRRRVPISACGIEAAGGCPGPARRIVEFRARERAAGVTTLSTYDEHLAVGQQRRRVKKPRGIEAASGTPGPAGWIVHFRAPERKAVRASIAYDEHLAVGQQRRRVKITCGDETAGGRPGAARRIVEFRAPSILSTGCDEHL